jgi:hypothetical protein
LRNDLHGLIEAVGLDQREACHGERGLQKWPGFGVDASGVVVADLYRWTGNSYHRATTAKTRVVLVSCIPYGRVCAVVAFAIAVSAIYATRFRTFPNLGLLAATVYWGGLNIALLTSFISRGWYGIKRAEIAAHRVTRGKRGTQQLSESLPQPRVANRRQSPPPAPVPGSASRHRKVSLRGRRVPAAPGELHRRGPAFGGRLIAATHG